MRIFRKSFDLWQRRARMGVAEGYDTWRRMWNVRMWNVSTFLHTYFERMQDNLAITSVPDQSFEEPKHDS